MKRETFNWIARIFAAALFIFGMLFYCGYGTFKEHIPWVNGDYTLWDNLWLTVFPIMFIGLAVGWKSAIVGGWIVLISVLCGLVGGLLIEGELVSYMFVPLVSGILYLAAGYNNARFEQY